MAWELGSGLRTDYDFNITQAYFAPDAGYNNGETTLLQLIGVDEEGEDVKEMFAVGKDWTSPDGGKTIASSKGKALIQKNSMYGHFITACLELDGVAELLAAKGDSTEAEVWVGLSFHMMEREITFGRNLDPTLRNMPNAFLGEGAVIAGDAKTSATAPVAPVAAKSTPVTAAAKVAAAKAKARIKPAAAATAPTDGDAASDQIIALQTLAQEHDSFDAFLDAAVALPGVSEDEELLNLVLDPDSSGFYALYGG